jgi:hypothetical protein
MMNRSGEKKYLSQRRKKNQYMMNRRGEKKYLSRRRKGFSNEELKVHEAINVVV